MSVQSVAPAGSHVPGAVADAPAVVLDRVTFAYPGTATPALEDVSLTVAAGEAVVIAGESGSGKSTLARLVTGLLRASVGSVRTGGVDAAHARRHELAAVAGLVFQNPNHQLVASTVRDELALGPRNLGVGEPETDERVADVAGRLDLERVLGEHPYRLGIAVRKRVALAAVLAMRPRILVLDEPTTGQGRHETNRTVALLREERASGTTLAVITHDLRFGAAVADRLVVLHAGRVAADGAMRDILGDDRMLASSGLEAPQLARLAARLGLPGPDGVPLDEDELLGLLAARGGDWPSDGPGA